MTVVQRTAQKPTTPGSKKTGAKPHSGLGRESIAVGVCENLSDADYIGSTHRGHGHCIAKGCDLNGMMAEIFGTRRARTGSTRTEKCCRRTSFVGSKRGTAQTMSFFCSHRSVGQPQNTGSQQVSTR
ncbi:thiamine pyrophosphate-dependent enzyme [Rhodococcus erythropolis]|uniref:thiamine pyrophosphate-dependent enzyme n=1 Tax=Rhodococcus erythropolis TaxID=1833 RepID=UPI00294A3672|nr:thiamine pyrophosphate-dependent enzyme [Rhodococcus erythropolis]MDV6276974.1 thiamine pyrophosphate-dependent enzyme [Rhodococcus erythropolis]